MTDFNSVEASIPDIKKHLEENPAAAQTILDAEKAREDGDQRSSLIKHLEAVLAKQSPEETVAPEEPGSQKTHSFFGKDYVRTPEGGFRQVAAEG